MGFWGVGVGDWGQGPARVGSGEGVAEGCASPWGWRPEDLPGELGLSGRLVLQPVGFRLF